MDNANTMLFTIGVCDRNNRVATKWAGSPVLFQPASVQVIGSANSVGLYIR